MFNTWLANILNSYLGEVVEELDSHNLGVGALQGDILLIDLKLRPDCLSLLELPIEVIAGSIGKISLKIPWSQLSSSPVLVTVQDVYLVAVPLSHRAYNEEKDSKLETTRKRRFLQKVEGISVIKRAAKSQHSKEEKLKRELWETMIATFMNNVQLSIENVHLRYEDSVSVPGRFISGGLCLESIMAETTNSKWKSCEINGKAKSIYKLVRFENFSTYWNSNDSSGPIISRSGCGWRVKMREIMSKYFKTPYPENVCLVPLSGKVKIMMNRSIADGSPRLLFDYQLKEIKVNLGKDQYHTMMEIQAALKFLELSRMHRKYRPTSSVFSKPKHWWIYAFRCIKIQFIEPYYWRSIKKHREKYRELLGLWKKRHQVGKSSSLKAKIKESEASLDVTSIMLARESAKYEVRVNSTASPKKKKKLLSKMSKVGGMIAERKQTIANNITSNSVIGILAASSLESQLLEICKAMGCSFENDDTTKPKTYIEHVFNFTVSRCVFRLKPVFVWTVTNFSVCVETRPSGLAYTVAARTEDMNISTEFGDRVLSTTNLLHNTEPGWPNVFSFVFEKNPLVTPTDFRLEMRLLPIHLFYQDTVASELLDFLFLPNTDCLEVTWGVIYQSYLYALQFSRFLQNCLNSRVTCDVKIDLHNPCIEIGQLGTVSDKGNKLVVDGGRLQICCAKPDDSLNSERIYNRVECLVSGMSLILSPGSIPFHNLTQDPHSEYHLIPSTKAVMSLTSSPLQPWILETTIKCIKLNISDKKISDLIDFLRDLPLPSRDQLNAKANKKLRWKIDRRWTIPNIGKLELLYLESQLSNQQLQDQKLSDQHQLSQDTQRISKDSKSSNGVYKPIGRYRPNHHQHGSSKVSSPDSLETNLDIDRFCRNIDLPGLEDNVSPGNPMCALLKLSIKDLSLVFDKVSENKTKSYLNLSVQDYVLDVGFLQFGPAVQMSVGGLKLVDLETTTVFGHHVELVALEGPSEALTVLYRYVHPKCPDFSSVFKSVQHSLVLDINSIQLSLHRSSIWLLISEFRRLMEMNNINKSSVTPMINSSKSLLKKLSTWKPFQLDSDLSDVRHTFFNLAVRVQQITALLSDSDQEYMNLSLTGAELDAVFRPRSKLLVRAFLGDVLVEDLTEFTSYPKVIWLEEGSAFECKLILNLSKRSSSSGTVNLSVGNLHFLLLHRVVRLFQLYFAPLNVDRITMKIKKYLASFPTHRIKTKLHGEQFIGLKISVDGPTFIFPESKENNQHLSLYAGKILVENFSLKDRVENILVDLNEGHVTRARINLNQGFDTEAVLVSNLSFKLDIKKYLANAMKNTVDVSIQDIDMKLDSVDMKLIYLIIQNNLRKILSERGTCMDHIAGVQDDSTSILSTEKIWSVNFFLDVFQVEIVDLEDDDRPVSPGLDTAGDVMFLMYAKGLNGSVEFSRRKVFNAGFTVERLDIEDKYLDASNPSVLSTADGSNLFWLEYVNCKDDRHLKMKTGFDIVHLYPATLLRVKTLLFDPTLSAGDGRSENSSINTLESYSDENESETTTSGYQTTHAQSPNPAFKERKVNVQVKEFKVVLHCSNHYRNDILVLPVSLEHCSETSTTRTSLVLGNLLLYSEGKYAMVCSGFDVLGREGQSLDRAGSSVDVSSFELHVNKCLFKVLKRLQDDYTAKSPPQTKCSLKQIWVNRKISRSESGSRPRGSRALADFFEKISGIRKLQNVRISDVKILLENKNCEPLIGVKCSSLLNILPSKNSCEIKGSVELEGVNFNTRLHRWERLLETGDQDRIPIKLDVSLGHTFSATDVDEISPNIAGTRSIEDDLKGRIDLAPSEKLRQLFENRVLISERMEADRKSSDDCFTEDTEGDSSELEDEDQERGEAGDLMGTVISHENWEINISDELLRNIVEITASSSSGKQKTGVLIENHLGINLTAEYIQLQNGKEKCLTSFEDNLDVNETTSSEDEEQYDDLLLPWSRLIKLPTTKFTGFQESLEEDVDQLTRVVTSHSLRININGFPPVNMLLPRASCSSNLPLEMEGVKYQAQICSRFASTLQCIRLQSTTQIWNSTDLNIIIYADSEDSNWNKSVKLNSENPFTSVMKLTEMFPNTGFMVPLFLSTTARFYIKPSNSRFSCSEEFIDIENLAFSDTRLSCVSQDKKDSVLFKVSLHESRGSNQILIQPVWTLHNHLPFDISLSFTEENEKTIPADGSGSLYQDIASIPEFSLKVHLPSREVILPCRSSVWESSGHVFDPTTSSSLEYSVQDSTVLLSSKYIVYNQTGLSISIKDIRDVDQVLSPGDAFLVQCDRLTFQLVDNGSTSHWNTVNLALRDEFTSAVMNMKCRPFQLLVSKLSTSFCTQVYLRPVWRVVNKTSKDLVVAELVDSRTRLFGSSEVVQGGTSANLWPLASPDSVMFGIKVANTELDYVTFRLRPPRTTAALRIDTEDGVGVELVESNHGGNTLLVFNPTITTIPFIFENRCTGIVLKVCQAGEKQSWLLNPGVTVPYTWDNWEQSRPRCTWSLYGSKEEPVTLNVSFGEVLSGETRVIHRTVKKYSRSSAADTSSETDVSEEASQELRNIVVKSRKSIFWITQNNPESKQTRVYFFTSRKSAHRMKYSLTRNQSTQFYAVFSNLALNLFENDREVGRISAEFETAKWTIFVNGEWTYLGEEMSSILETYFNRNIQTLTVSTFFQFDLKSMTIVAPLFAPLRRFLSPSLAAELKLSDTVLSAKLGLASLRMENSESKPLSVDTRIFSAKTRLSVEDDLDDSWLRKFLKLLHFDKTVSGNQKLSGHLPQPRRSDKNQETIGVSKLFTNFRSFFGEDSQKEIAKSDKDANFWQIINHLSNNISRAKKLHKLPFSLEKYPWLHSSFVQQLPNPSTASLTAACARTSQFAAVLKDIGWNGESHIYREAIARHFIRLHGHGTTHLRRPASNWLGVRSYNGFQSVGRALLLHLVGDLVDDGDNYVHHSVLSENNSLSNILFVTERLVLMVTLHSGTGRSKLDWVLKTSEIQEVPVLTDNTLAIFYRKEKERLEQTVQSGNKSALSRCKSAIEVSLLLLLPLTKIHEIQFRNPR